MRSSLRSVMSSVMDVFPFPPFLVQAVQAGAVALLRLPEQSIHDHARATRADCRNGSWRSTKCFCIVLPPFCTVSTM
jgi:hypothetical protein